MIGLQNGKKNIAEKFNRLSRVHERHRQTTDTIASQRRCSPASAVVTLRDSGAVYKCTDYYYYYCHAISRT